MSACPVNAITVDDATGAKRVIDSLCIGCHLCTVACPFGTVFTLPQGDKAGKCNLCNGQPACALACPTQAIEYVDVEHTGNWFAPWSEKVHTNHIEALP